MWYRYYETDIITHCRVWADTEFTSDSKSSHWIFSSSSKSPKIRTFLNQLERVSELLPPLPQCNSTMETKKHPGAANSHHEPWPLASASTVQPWDEGRLDFPFGESWGREGVGRLCVGGISFSLEIPSIALPWSNPVTVSPFGLL